MGRSVYTEMNISNLTSYQIDASQWKAGIYLLIINGHYAAKLVVL
jgi:hypothetical protein